MCTDKSVAYDNILNWKPWHTHTHCKEVGIMFWNSLVTCV